MSEAPLPAEAPVTPPPLPKPPSRFRWPLAIVLAGCVTALITYAAVSEPAQSADDTDAETKGPLGMRRLGEREPGAVRTRDDNDKKEDKKKVAAPELDGGIAWLNTGGPLSLKKDLKGKVVILDFWTLCCINCIHIMPDLAKLEKKYPNELVVIGVHSPKFESEKLTANIRKA